MRTLFSGGVIASPGSDLEWVLVSDGMIAGTGRGESPPHDRHLDLGGGALAPSFCDAHVHLPATGLYLAGLDLRGTRGKEAILDALAAQAKEDGILFGGNFEDTRDEDLTRHDLDGVAGDRPAMLARADMHSCVVSTALLEKVDLPDEGVDRDERGEPTGYLREKAAAEAWRWFDANLPVADQRAALDRAISRALSKGVTEVHEMYVAEWRGWDSLELLLEVRGSSDLRIVPYVATEDVERVRSLGLRTIGGDHFLDGSFGSHTAWLSEPYTSTPPEGSSPTGLAYRSDQELEEFFASAHAAGMQVGVHVIGDAAIDQALRAWAQVAASDESVRLAGHRLEHFECAWDEHIAAAADLGLRISAQPAFDRLWGGAGGLYESRIGVDRSRKMNRFGSMISAGLVLGAGSDSTVTPLDPFLQMAALREHHEPEEGLTADQALQVHTVGSRALAAERDGSGELVPGAPADLVWLDRDPLMVDPDELLKTEVLGTWRSGRLVWPEPEGEIA